MGLEITGEIGGTGGETGFGVSESACLGIVVTGKEGGADIGGFGGKAGDWTVGFDTGFGVSETIGKFGGGMPAEDFGSSIERIVSTN